MSEQKDLERAAFEAWYLREIEDGQDSLIKYPNGHYINDTTMDAWYGWQARASLPVGVPDGYMPIPTAWQLADALENVRCYHDMSAELIAPELLANLLASTTAKAEQVDVCDTCHGQGEVYSGHDQNFHYFDFQPPEPIMEVCPECGGEEAPSLPAAGSAVEEVEVVAWRYRHSEQEKWQAGVERKSLWETEPLMTVAQHERIVAALSAQQSAQPEFCCEHSYKVAKQAAWCARDLTQCKCDHNEYCEHCWPDDFKEGGKWYNGFEAQQSAPERVSVPVELLERVCWPVVSGSDRHTHSEAVAELRALLASHGRGEA